MIGFEQCIIAAGSEPARIPGLPDDPRVVDSTGALELAGIPKRLLVIGGGIIGLEMACVYDGARLQGERRRADRHADAGLRPRSGAAAREAAARALRGDPDRHARSRASRRATTGCGDVRGQGRAASRSSTTACCARSGACRTAGDRRRGGRRARRRARLHPGRPADAHQRAAHLRDRRHRRPADARPQGDARGQGRGRGRRRARRARSMRA